MKTVIRVILLIILFLTNYDFLKSDFVKDNIKEINYEISKVFDDSFNSLMQNQYSPIVEEVEESCSFTKRYLGVMLVLSSVFLFIFIFMYYEVKRRKREIEYKLMRENELNKKIEEIKTLNEELSELNKTLKEEKERSESVSELKSIFVSNMSHEIRTPLNGIVGVIDFLKDSKLDEEQKELIDLLEISSKNLMQIINDILDLAKIETGKICLIESNFRLTDVVNSSLKIIESLIISDKKNIIIKKDIEGLFSDYVKGDKIKIEQILVNLLSNAYKLTEFGEILLKLELLSKTNDQILVKFTIKDTGIGIDESIIPKIKNRFVQEDNNLEKKYKGTGLGLAIVTELIELLGGSININSKTNMGTEVSFELKFKNVDEHIYIDNIDNEFKIRESTKILIVEDNAINRNIIKKGLSKYSIRIDIAEDGVVAKQLFDNNKYDIILLDIQLPDISGYDVCKYIRLYDKDVKIIAVTAYANKDSKEKALNVGMNEYITKPFKMKELLEKIEKVLNREK